MHCNGSTACLLHPLHILHSTPDECKAPRSDKEVPYLSRNTFYFSRLDIFPPGGDPALVDTGFDNRLHDIGLVSCDFRGVFIWKRKNGTKRIGLVRPRVNRRPIRYEMKKVSCKQKTNPIWNENGIHCVNGVLEKRQYGEKIRGCRGNLVKQWTWSFCWSCASVCCMRSSVCCKKSWKTNFMDKKKKTIIRDFKNQNTLSTWC